MIATSRAHALRRVPPGAGRSRSRRSQAPRADTLRQRFAAGLCGLALLAGCATTSTIAPAERAELAPGGKMRVGIDYGASILAGKEPLRGALRGVDVDLARALARRAGVPVELVGYARELSLLDDLERGRLDAALVSAERARARPVNYAPSYAVIDATFLVPAGSPVRSVADLDRDGVRIAVADQSTYDSFLGRTLQRARLLRAPDAHAAYELFRSAKLDALAGLRPRLEVDAAMLPGSRVLDGRFTTIEQTIASPQGRDGAARYLHEFVEHTKASGLIADLLEKNGARGVSVAPAARVQ